jgi:pimeloyl-ACP methyl ester carboxylesterase
MIHNGPGGGGPDGDNRRVRGTGHRAVARVRPAVPPDWSDRIGEFFAEARLIHLDGVGHFTPREAPRDFAAAVIAASAGPGAG